MRAEQIFLEAKGLGTLGFGVVVANGKTWQVSRIADIFIGVIKENPFKRKDLQKYFDKYSKQELVSIISKKLTNEVLEELENQTGISEETLFSKLASIYTVYILMSRAIQQEPDPRHASKSLIEQEDQYEEDTTSLKKKVGNGKLLMGEDISGV